MAVVGLDIGSYSCFVAVAAGGGIDTIDNEYSLRATPAYVSLGERNRSMGVSAKNQATTNLKNTVSGFKRLIARRFCDPQVQDEINNYPKPFKITEGPAGETLVQVQYMEELQTFTPEQISAMLLTKLKETAENGMKTKVVDIVISVPSFFTDVERRSMVAVCQMAGLNCVKIMNDTSAVSLAYGIYKQDLPEEKEKSRNVVFVDVGYSSIQVSATSFNKGKLKVLAVASDTNVGGRDFDKLIVDHFVKEWKTQYKIDVMSNPKAYIRLTVECEKLKKLMSANSQNIPLNIECFMNDKDVRGVMNRERFVELAAPLLQKAETLFKKILTASKLSPDDIYSVEVVGGSSRIPSIKELVAKIFMKEPSTTLNADEAVAKGCALQCAILSPTFRVRDFSIIDCQPYPITLSWQGGGLEDDTSLEVFPEFHQIPFSKMLTFYRKEDFDLESRYSKPGQVPMQDTGLGVFKISKVQPQANGESSKVKVKVRVNSHGIFNVQSASMIETLEDKEEEQGPESMETENGKENKPDVAQSMETDQSPSNGDQTKADEKPVDDAEMKEEKGDDKSDKKEEDGKKSPEKKDKKKKPSTKSIDLTIEGLVSNYSKQAIELYREKENNMVMQDKLEKERCDAKNGVEEYVYDMRDKLCGPFEEFCKEEDREQFNKLLGDTEDWLYGDGENQMKQVYLDKFSELRKYGDPITSRYNESSERPAAFDALGASLQSVRKFIASWEAKDEKYIHLEKSDIEKVKKCLKEKTEWFDKQMNAQNALKKFDTPAVWSSQIHQTRQSLESLCNPIISKPKPKPKEEPPKDTEKDAKKDAPEEQKENAENTEKAAGDAKKETGSSPASDMDVD